MTKGATLRSHTEWIDIPTVGCRPTLNIFGSFAEFEPDLVKERTIACLAAARARGRIGGQPSEIDADEARHIRRMLDDGTPKSEIAARLKLAEPFGTGTSPPLAAVDGTIPGLESPSGRAAVSGTRPW